jgi:hypothetical protein
MPNDGADPLVTFYRFIPRARQPIRADASAGGVLSMRGFRYCEPLRTASQFGWYVFPPMDFQLLWDGHEIFWAYDKKSWSPLTRTHFPGFSKQFDEHAPDDCRGYAPPFLGAGPEPGHVMIWSGWAARTAPDRSLLVRSVPNLPRSSGLDNYEGILEADDWFGPLFVTARLCRTGVPILVRREHPIFAVQPLPRDAYSAQTLDRFAVVDSLAELGDEQWDRYRQSIVKNQSDPQRRYGHHAIARRRRAAKERTATG